MINDIASVIAGRMTRESNHDRFGTGRFPDMLPSIAKTRLAFLRPGFVGKVRRLLGGLEPVVDAKLYV